MNLPKTFDPTKIPIRASTQEHLDIEDIQDGIIILRDGSCCLVIATTAINFGLLSEKEQEATIYAYAGLLNSLTFSIQVVLRSQRKDISGYIKLVKRAGEKETKKEIKAQIEKYRQFIEETVAKNEVLDKKFYIVIPMSALELGVKQALTSAFALKKLPFDKDYILQKAKTNLYPKRDHVLRQVARLGLKGKQLNTQELIQLFFNIYNPEVKGQQLTTTEQYQRPMVEPAMAKVKEVSTILEKPSPTSETETQKVESKKPVQSPGPAKGWSSSGREIEVETKPVKEESIQNQINGLIKKAVGR